MHDDCILCMAAMQCQQLHCAVLGPTHRTLTCTLICGWVEGLLAMSAIE
jgi:hypothetical protein